MLIFDQIERGINQHYLFHHTNNNLSITKNYTTTDSRLNIPINNKNYYVLKTREPEQNKKNSSERFVNGSLQGSSGNKFLYWLTEVCSLPFAALISIALVYFSYP